MGQDLEERSGKPQTRPERSRFKAAEPQKNLDPFLQARAESSLAIQVRTDKIGFAELFYRQRAPNVFSMAC